METSPASARRDPLSRERVLRAALALADADGLATVTMRRLAADLEVEAMSLYHHIPGKDALLNGLVERVIGEVQEELAGLPAASDWRETVRARCLTARSVMLRHPWAPGLISASGRMPFAAYALYEAVLAAFVDGGVGYRIGHRGLHALGSMILGFVQEPFRPGESAEAGADESELALLAERMPHLTAMMAVGLHAASDPSLGWCDTQAEFEFTLSLLLDGLAREAARG